MSGITQEQLLWRIIDKLNEAIHSQHETIEFLMNKRLRRPEWAGLTDEERSELWWNTDMSDMPEHDYGKAIEAKLKEKNT